MFFPELIGLELDALMSRFCSGNLDDHLLPERDFWFQEIAMSIAAHGDDGFSFLISRIPNADPDRLRAIVLSFSFLPKVIASQHLAELTAMLQVFLSHKDPIITMEAIYTTNALGIKCLQHDVEALLNHKSPFVVGGVLRYLTSLFPE